MVALSDVETITAAVVALFVLLAILTLARVVMKREGRWLRIRVGLFIERDMTRGGRRARGEEDAENGDE